MVKFCEQYSLYDCSLQPLIMHFKIINLHEIKVKHFCVYRQEKNIGDKRCQISVHS